LLFVFLIKGFVSALNDLSPPLVHVIFFVFLLMYFCPLPARAFFLFLLSFSPLRRDLSSWIPPLSQCLISFFSLFRKCSWNLDASPPSFLSVWNAHFFQKQGRPFPRAPFSFSFSFVGPDPLFSASFGLLGKDFSFPLLLPFPPLVGYCFSFSS